MTLGQWKKLWLDLISPPGTKALTALGETLAVWPPRPVSPTSGGSPARPLACNRMPSGIVYT